MSSAAGIANIVQQYSNRYRWNVIFLLTACQAIAYMDRVNMSVVVPVLIRQHGYSAATVGILMSMFNWSYTIAQLFSGPFVDWVRVRVAYTGGVGVWAIATALCGTTVRFGPFAAFRALVGVGESVMVPSGQRIILETFPKEQRGRAVGWFFAGNKLGLSLGIPFSTMILAAWGMPAVFYITGLLSLFWVPWLLLSYRAPALKPEAKQAGSPTMSWGKLLKYRTTWGLIIGNAGYLYMVFVFVTWLPGYLVLQRKMSMLRGSMVGMVTFIIAFGATVFGGWLSDQIGRRTRVTVARKVMTCGGLFLATIFTLLAAYTPGLWLAILFVILTVASYSLATGSLNAMPVDVAPPKYVSSLASLMNVGGNLGGALAPMVTGILFARTGSFQIPLLVAAIITLVFGCGCFGLVVGSLETRLGDEVAAPAASS